MRTLTLIASLLLVLGTACGNDTNNTPKDTGPGKDTTKPPDGDSGPPPNATLQFLPKPVDNARAGEYTGISSGGGKIAVAYYRNLDQTAWPTVTCPATFSGGGGPKARPGHDVMYSESTDGGVTWSTPVMAAQSVGAVHGLSIALTSAGAAHIGYLGGEMSLQECASSDAYIASSNDGVAWTTQMLDSAGAIGDTVGHWISVAIDGSGQPQAAYRDVRFGLYEQTGNSKSSLRYSATEAVLNNGSGLFTRLQFKADGTPIIMHFNPHQTDGTGGIQLVVQQGSTWSGKQLVAGGTSERPDFAGDGNGTWGLAYYEPSATSLHYIESSDLTSWSQPIIVDISTTKNGEFASLAFDSKGNPGISYYRCGPASSPGSSCEPSEDGLMFAYRLNGTWKTYEVDTGGSYTCGDHTALTFNDKDEPVIAYRCVTLKNAGNEFVDTLKVARGFWKQ
ncbi:MAG: hypothetical protein KC503_36340 [Myxococcales bacterium]|nr:hypothetical protein [Myxococcales bacterium]